MPSMNIGTELSNGWRLNLNVETRESLFRGSLNDVVNFDHNHQLTDLTILAGRKALGRLTATGGYLARFRDERTIHRTLQQVAWVQDFHALRLSHRISSDQTFSSDSPPTFRLRYRIGTEIALQGLEVDPREFYIKLTNEYLGSSEAGTQDIEVRLVSLIGYELSITSKLEIGPDYRASSLVQEGSDNRLWLRVSWYHRI